MPKTGRSPSQIPRPIDLRRREDLEGIISPIELHVTCLPNEKNANSETCSLSCAGVGYLMTRQLGTLASPASRRSARSPTVTTSRPERNVRVRDSARPYVLSQYLGGIILCLFTSPNLLPPPPKHLAATEPTMSSTQKPPVHHRHSSSTDALKNADVNGNDTPEPLVNQDYYTRYPNNWSKIRELIREPAAEMLGTMILTLFGCAGNCQVVLSANTGVASSPKGDYLSLALGWACGVGLGAWVSGGVSGGHVNPVVTVCSAVFRGFPWRKVPGYVLGQLIGAWAGAIIVFGNYFHAIDIVEGGKGRRSLRTGSLFGTFALDYMPAANCFFDEFIGAFILLLVVFAVTDKRNGTPAGLVPLIVFITILGIGTSFGMQTGFAINPARDLGPRIMTAMVGYGRQVFNYRSQYWIWSPILGSFSGGLVACLLYDVLIYLGPESPVNAPNEAARHHIAHNKNVDSALPSGSHGVQEV